MAVVFVGFVLLIASVLLVYMNNILYVVSVLLVSSYVLFFLVSNMLVSVLVFLLIVIVYVGAMIVLVGYICAICPNPILLPRFFGGFACLSVSFIFCLLSPFESGISGVSNTNSVSDFFFSSWGLASFLSVVFMLFITLLIVTSHSSFHRGPFRSVS